MQHIYVDMRLIEIKKHRIFLWEQAQKINPIAPLKLKTTRKNKYGQYL